MIPSPRRLLLWVSLTLLPVSAFGAFGLTTATDYYQVDTGAGLVFEIRRTDNGSNTQSPGDLMSLVYNGTEYQDQTRGSQVNSGFDYLYNGVTAVTVSAAAVNTNYIVITVTAGSLTHYYMARNGDPCIYMATYFTAEPDIDGLCRYIVRIPNASLPNGPTPSNILNNTGAIESSDVFGMADGTTRSKHYSNMRLKDWSYIGATGTNAGIWIVRDNNEGNSGGPFYRCLLNQGATDQEITYIVNYGESQTEAFRPGILNHYTLVCTTGAPPGAVDTSWFSGLGLTGYVPDAGRGAVTCPGMSGLDATTTYTIGFANATAQYSTDAAASNGAFSLTGMIPGTYTMTVYRNELNVYTASVTITAGGTLAPGSIAITGDPNFTVPTWRIGTWDGSPGEFLNGNLITYMHPSDVRVAAWSPGTYVVGTSTAATGMPCYQWKNVNGSQAIQFTLTAAQVVASTVRVGITTAYAGGRPNISVNSWTATDQNPATQPSTRSLTIGSYRGNNTTYTFSVPASALVAGTNTLYVFPISGSSGTTYLSPGYSLDCIDFYQGTAQILPIPAAPATLNATVGSSQIALSWPAVAGAATYTLGRGTVSGGPYTAVAPGVATTSYTDASVATGTLYYYVVAASNTSGTGLSTPEVKAAAGLLPPTNLTATPASNRAALTWVSTGTPSSFNVKRATTSGGPYTTVASGLTAPGYIDTGLTNSITYYYVISAVYSAAESNSTETSVTPIATALIAFLRFDESSGTAASDSTGDGWNGTLVNGPTWTSGKINNAVALSGSSQYVSLPTGIVSGVGDFTVAAWVKPTALTKWARVFDFGTGTTNYMYLASYNPATSKPRFAIRTPAVNEQIIDGTALTAGVWTHVAVTLSGATGTMYVNGVAAGSNTGFTLKPASLGSTTQNYVGRSQFSADTYLNGAVDELQVYGRALAATEIAALAAPPAAPGGLASAAGNAQVTIGWSAVSGATGYNVKRAATSGGPYAVVANGLTTTSYTNTGLTNGTTYYYVVTASAGVADSVNSTEASGRPTAPITSAEQTEITVATSGGTATITQKSSVVGHTYQLQYCTDLVAGVWQNYGSAVAGNGSDLAFTAPTSLNAACCFFRLSIHP